MTTACPIIADAPNLPSIVLAEWQSCHLAGVVLSDEDRQLARLLEESADSRVAIDELRTGLRITAKSWVGLVRFSAFELQIIPKLVGDNLGLVDLIDFAAGLDCLDRHPAIRNIKGAGTSLFDLIALLFAEACERLARGGLLADYREIEDDLTVLRGRLRFREQVLKHFGRIDRLECRYDEQITDTIENQIVLAGLAACAGRVRHPAVSLRIRRLLNIFSEACSLDELDLRSARTTVVYNRLNKPYREPHALAWLVLDGLGIENVYAADKQQWFAFLLDMNRLFEDFITRWLTQLVTGSGLRVLPQRRDKTILWDADHREPYASVIPDILIERRDTLGQFLPVDAKYKLYDEKNVSTSDIYQSFLYAISLGHGGLSLPTALLLYPASSPEGKRVRLHICRSNGTAVAELQALGIHIPTALAEATHQTAGEIGKSLRSLLSAHLVTASE